jgi:hypothetical protein
MMTKPMEELARDEAANAWVDANVPEQFVAQLRAWVRMQIEQHVADDQAEIGVLLIKPGLMQAAPGATPVRAYVQHPYALMSTV